MAFEYHSNPIKEPIRTAGNWASNTVQEMKKSLNAIFLQDPKANLTKSKGAIGKAADVAGGMVASTLREGIRLPLTVITGITMNTTRGIAEVLGDVVKIGGKAAVNNLRIIAMPASRPTEERRS